MTTELSSEPNYNCDLCPRLRGFIAEWRGKRPGWHNGPVPSFVATEGPASVRLLVVGLAPGLQGANRTGRPFTGDFAGDLLYGTLIKHGFAKGTFDARPDDGVNLVKTAITNAVRCVPPQNKPVASEINTCRNFLIGTIGQFRNLQAIVTLGKIAHDSTIRALDGRVSEHKFGHDLSTELGGLTIFSSYHCSRYNTNTGRLSEEMFSNVFSKVARFLAK